MRQARGLELRIPPVVVLLAAGAALGWTSHALEALRYPGPAALAAGVLLAIAGAMLCVLAVVDFRRARTTVDPRHPERTSALITHGIYGRSRNPMYLGFVLLLAAAGAALGNALALLLVPAFGAFLARFQVAPEERLLAEKFGDEYERYRARTARWWSLSAGQARGPLPAEREDVSRGP